MVKSKKKTYYDICCEHHHGSCAVQLWANSDSEAIKLGRKALKVKYGEWVTFNFTTLHIR